MPTHDIIDNRNEKRGSADSRVVCVSLRFSFPNNHVVKFIEVRAAE